jgi:hypothetical protein
MPEGVGLEENKAAFYRRFWHVNIFNLLRVLGLKLLPKQERVLLQKEGNSDPSKLFLSWDYATDLPTATPLREFTHYQQVIKDNFYA